MRFWKQLSIRWKLSTIIVLCSMIALLLASTALAIYVYSESRTSLAEHVELLASVVAENSSAALVFDDHKTAVDLLASLRADEYLVWAALFDASGQPFADYPTHRDVAPLEPSQAGVEFGTDSVRVIRPVTLNEELIGFVVVEQSLEPLWNQLKSHIFITLGVLVLSLSLTWFVSLGVQRIISQRIISLAKTAREVSETSNYALRAEGADPDELGSLVSRFNEMLDLIEQRQEALVKAHMDLEVTVDERTWELEQEVAERRRVEADLRAFARDLERSNRDLQDFAYVASHDLQEPLRKIQAFGDRLGKSAANVLDSQDKDYLARMLDAAGRMRTLISDLLAFSRVATKGQPFEEVDLTGLIDHILGDLEIQIDERNAKIEIGSMPTILADPGQIRQLLQNLIGNAIKFSDNSEQPLIRVQAKKIVVGQSSMHRISVEDNGIGIDPKYFNRIFGVFQRLHGRGAYAGSGMGLSICRRVVERHGGRISVESEPGKGSRFIVDLPVRPVPRPHPAHPQEGVS